MGHTPGPWWVDEDGDYLCICEGEANEFGERNEVAQLYCNRPSLKASQPANAHLIAAAPELLAALQEAVTALNVKEKFPVYDTDSYAIAARCDKAIAKAEGRSE